MKAVVARLARKIKDALAMRQRQEEKGRLDSRRTIRQSLPVRRRSRWRCASGGATARSPS